MNYEYELEFLQDVLKKCHINNGIISSGESINAIIDPLFAKIIGFQSSATVEEVLGSLDNKTKYKFADEFKLHYIYMKLPSPDEKNVLFIGPYLSSPLSSQDILEIGEGAGIPIASQKNLKEYYFSTPILTESDRLLVMIDVFCERIWDTSSFAIVEVDNKYMSSQFLTPATAHGESIEDIEANIKVMEKRYAFENELIRSVTLGQQHKEGLLFSKLTNSTFELRVADPLRNAKNYCIIMNTLLRKAAESGGVHPIYIDSTSSKFALRIELLSDVKACSAMMKEMFSSYCRLVYNHSVKNYSPIIQKTILIINSNISSELSLNLLAKKLGISAGYLSTLFKKETGKNVLEFIKEKRIEHAMYLLSTTHLQIQTVALHCGIMDVQYFSKIFKKQTGKTPKEYRESTLR
jgi:AraC-like DNA-binding protein